MIELHPEYLDKDGKPIFVVLPFEEFEALKTYLDDTQDLLDLRKAKREEADAPTLSLDEVKSRFRDEV